MSSFRLIAPAGAAPRPGATTPDGAPFAAVIVAARAGAPWAWTVLHRALAAPLARHLRLCGDQDPLAGVADVMRGLASRLAMFDGDEAGLRQVAFGLACARCPAGGPDELRRLSVLGGLRAEQVAAAAGRSFYAVQEALCDWDPDEYLALVDLPAVPAAAERAHVAAAIAALPPRESPHRRRRHVALGRRSSTALTVSALLVAALSGQALGLAAAPVVAGDRVVSPPVVAPAAPPTPPAPAADPQPAHERARIPDPLPPAPAAAQRAARTQRVLRRAAAGAVAGGAGTAAAAADPGKATAAEARTRAPQRQERPGVPPSEPVLDRRPAVELPEASAAQRPAAKGDGAGGREDRGDPGAARDGAPDAGQD